MTEVKRYYDRLGNELKEFYDNSFLSRQMIFTCSFDTIYRCTFQHLSVQKVEAKQFQFFAAAIWFIVRVIFSFILNSALLEDEK